MEKRETNTKKIETKPNTKNMEIQTDNLFMKFDIIINRLKTKLISKTNEKISVYALPKNRFKKIRKKTHKKIINMIRRRRRDFVEIFFYIIQNVKA